ncbi:MAG: OmpP1/FadL family transporter [bacterium]
MKLRGNRIIITKVILVSVVSLLISFMFITNSFANGVLLDAKGPITLGRGGTNIAHSDNGILIYDNPAALARLQGKKIEGALDMLMFPMKYKDSSNNKKGEDQAFFLPTFAYTHNIQQSRFGMGAGVYNPAGFSAEYNLNHPVYGEQKYFSNASLTKILLGAGYNITDKWSFGIGFGPSYSNMELEMPYTFQTGPLQGTPSLIDMEGDDWSLTWNLGTQWQASSSTTVGLSYICQDEFRVEGDTDVEVMGLGTSNYKVGFDFRWPQILGAGVKHLYKTNHSISLDVLWIDWSSAFNEMKLELSEGNGVGWPGSAQDTFPLHWKDSYSLRLGYEYFLNAKDTLRFGYIYNENPVPSSTLTPLIPGIIKHEVSLGYGRTWGKWAFNVSYLYAFKSEQSVSNSEILGGDFDQSTVKISAHFLSLRFQY